MVGKWHGGFLPHFSPLKSGWDTFYGNYSGGLDYFSKYAGNGYDLYEGETQVQDPRYYTDIITEKAVKVIRDRKRQSEPWLFNLNFTTPHWPWEGRGDKAVSDELTARLRAGQSQALFHYDGGSLEKYEEMVEDLDRSIGIVLDELRRTGQEKDTIVLFASDNGGERFSYNWPLSGNKASVLEGGIRVPMIAVLAGRAREAAGRRHPGLHVRLDRHVPRARWCGAGPGLRPRRDQPGAAPVRGSGRRPSATCSGGPARDARCAAGT